MQVCIGMQEGSLCKSYRGLCHDLFPELSPSYPTSQHQVTFIATHLPGDPQAALTSPNSILSGPMGHPLVASASAARTPVRTRPLHSRGFWHCTWSCGQHMMITHPYTEWP